MHTIYVLGNPLVPSDRQAVSLLPFLRHSCVQYRFTHFDPTEEIAEIDERVFVCIDTVAGIEKITVFNRLDDFAVSPRFSAHDYDLPIQLSLLQKLGKINAFAIIGIPLSFPRYFQKVRGTAHAGVVGAHDLLNLLNEGRFFL